MFFDKQWGYLKKTHKKFLDIFKMSIYLSFKYLYTLFINSNLYINILKFCNIIKIIFLDFINIIFYMYLYIFKCSFVNFNNLKEFL